MQGTEEFIMALAELGTSNNPTNDIIDGIEKFMCDVPRHFWRNFSRDKKSQMFLCYIHAKTASLGTSNDQII